MNERIVDKPKVRVRLTVLSEGEGGRSTPIYDQDTYRPHIVIGDPNHRRVEVGPHGEGTEDYLGVVFLGNGRVLELGQQYEVELALVYHPHVDYGAVTKGATFTVREGHTVVAFGEVIDDPRIERC